MKKPLKGKWVVRRTIWPYADGWGVVNDTTRTILETGIPSKEAAQAIADELNAHAKEKKHRKASKERV